MDCPTSDHLYIYFIFKHKNSYQNNMRHYSQFSAPIVKTISYPGPIIRDILPVTSKELRSLKAFKNIKKWKPENCPCRLCKTRIIRIGFI